MGRPLLGVPEWATTAVSLSYWLIDPCPPGRGGKGHICACTATRCPARLAARVGSHGGGVRRIEFGQTQSSTGRGDPSAGGRPCVRAVCRQGRRATGHPPRHPDARAASWRPGSEARAQKDALSTSAALVHSCMSSSKSSPRPAVIAAMSSGVPGRSPVKDARRRDPETLFKGYVRPATP